MRHIILTLVLSVVGVLGKAQTVEPPTDADEFGWLRWAVIILLGALITGSGSFVAYIKSTHNARIKDKDDEILRLTTALQDEQRKNERIQGEKDALYKEVQDKVVPAITTATNLIQSFLSNGK